MLTLLTTLIVHGIMGIPVNPGLEVGKDTPVTQVIAALLNRNLLILSAVAITITLIWAYAHNKGYIYGRLNSLGITYKTSRVGVWSDVFNTYRDFWIRIRFSDGRLLEGWPKYYSSEGKPKEIFVADAT